MDTTIVREKIRDLEAKSNNDFSKQIIREFKSWFAATENYLAEVEQNNFELTHIIESQDKLIELLTKLVILTGNADKLVQLQVMDQEKTDLVIDFLLKSNDRVNHVNLYGIATLLELAKREGKVINDLKRLVDYARTGE